MFTCYAQMAGVGWTDLRRLLAKGDLGGDAAVQMYERGATVRALMHGEGALARRVG